MKAPPLRGFLFCAVSSSFPCEAGIQALKMVSRAWRAISKAMCGWLRPRTLGGFLLFGQKKATKEKAARSRRLLPALLAGIGARLTRRALNNAPRAQTRGSLLPIPAAMLGGGYGMGATHLSSSRGGVLKNPLWSSRARREGTGEAGADQGACFLWFLWPALKKPWVGGGASRIQITRPQAARQSINVSGSNSHHLARAASRTRRAGRGGHAC